MKTLPWQREDGYQIDNRFITKIELDSIFVGQFRLYTKGSAGALIQIQRNVL